MNARILIVLLFVGLLSSCIRKEALNTEADIEECKVVSPFGAVMDIRIDNREITFFVKAGADLSKVEMEFRLTPGAVLENPQPYYDLEKDLKLTVVSEDGQWKKVYFCRTHVANVSIPRKFGFEHFVLHEDTYYRFYEVLPNDPTSRLKIWDSGNEGFRAIASRKGPDEYPTCYSVEGRNGKCVKMVTQGTGLGSLVGMPIAAGNLFIGKFNPDAIQIGNPTASLKATEFGWDFDFMPKGIRGYYKYKAGEKFLAENGKTDPDRKDEFDIYGMVYEPTEEYPFVDGSNQFDCPALVMLARMDAEDRVETGEWKEFYIPFVSVGGRKMDPEKLKAGRYRISVIFTSSIKGDRFIGAAGSTLLVDDVEILVEE